MRAATEQVTNPTGLADKRIGDLYQKMEEILALAPQLRSLAEIRQQIVDVAAYTGEKLRTKLVEGTAPEVGGSANASHGLDAADIVDYRFLIRGVDGTLTKPDGVVFDAYVGASYCTVDLSAGATNLASRTFTCLITYREEE